MNTTPIKPTLQAMEVGRQTYFPRTRRKSVAKSYIGCSDDFLRTLREKALISFSQFGKMIWYDLSSIDRFIQSNKVV